MATEYPVIAARIRITTANQRLVFSEGAGDLDADIATGDYYVYGDNTGDAPADDLCTALKVALDAAGAETYDCFYRALIGAAEVTGRVVIQATNGFTLKWAAAATTVSPLWFGYATANSALADEHTSTLSPSHTWSANQPIVVKDEGALEQIVHQRRTPSGKRYTYAVGSPARRRQLALRSLVARRAKDQYVATGDDAGAFEYLWRNALTDGRPFKLFAAQVATGTELNELVAGNTEGTYILDEDSCKNLEVAREVRSPRFRADLGMWESV